MKLRKSISGELSRTEYEQNTENEEPTIEIDETDNKKDTIFTTLEENINSKENLQNETDNKKNTTIVENINSSMKNKSIEKMRIKQFGLSGESTDNTADTEETLDCEEKTKKIKVCGESTGDKADSEENLQKEDIIGRENVTEHELPTTEIDETDSKKNTIITTLGENINSEENLQKEDIIRQDNPTEHEEPTIEIDETDNKKNTTIVENINSSMKNKSIEKMRIKQFGLSGESTDNTADTEETLDCEEKTKKIKVCGESTGDKADSEENLQKEDIIGRENVTEHELPTTEIDETDSKKNTTIVENINSSMKNKSIEKMRIKQFGLSGESTDNTTDTEENLQKEDTFRVENPKIETEEPTIKIDESIQEQTELFSTNTSGGIIGTFDHCDNCVTQFLNQIFKHNINIEFLKQIVEDDLTKSCINGRVHQNYFET